MQLPSAAASSLFILTPTLSREAPAPRLPRRLPSGSDGEEVAGPPVLAQGDLKKGPRSPRSKRPQTPELLGGFVQPKGVRNFTEMVPAQGDLEMAVLRVKVGGRAGDCAAQPAALPVPGLERYSPAKCAGRSNPAFWERAETALLRFLRLHSTPYRMDINGYK